MIVRMKKIHMIVQDKDLVGALESLREAGLVHVVHETKPAGADVQELREQCRVLEKVITRLSQEEPAGEELRVEDWQQKAHEILGLLIFINQQEETIVHRQRQITQWKAWGPFEPEDIETLAAKGVVVRFVEARESQLKGIPEGVILEEISRSKGVVRCLAFSRGPVPLPFPVLPLPDVGLEEMKQAQERSRQRIAGAKNKIRLAARYLTNFKEILSVVREDLQFQEVYTGRGREGRLALVKGYCPAEECDELSRMAKRRHWALVVEDPEDEDEVPTLLRNPRWVELVKPVFQMVNILPGYREYDISVVFLFFFSVFFGMLIGDAGYGLIFLLLTVFFHVAMGKKVPDKAPFFLMYVMSAVTIAWGMMTGTFFGQAWIPPGTIRPLVPWLDNSQNVQMLCFLIGATHLSIGHIWRAVQKAPALEALAEVGWLLLIWGMFFVADMLIIGKPFPSSAKVLFFVGPALVILFTSPQKNIFKALGVGLGRFLLNVISSFSDIVSYIRLFAVGLATVAVADSFNGIALQIGFNHVVTSLISAIILVIGHLFNITLGCMALLVHGLRLNVLEFSNHMGLEWTGFRYDPFRKIRKI